MTEKEKIELLEEIMDVDPGTIHLNDALAEYEELDSLTALTYISEKDERFARKVTGQDIKAFVTVADAIAIMN